MTSMILFSRQLSHRVARSSVQLFRRCLNTNVLPDPIDRVPKDDETPFHVSIPEDSFEVHDLDRPPHTLQVTKTLLRSLFADMYKIRRLETAADRLYKAGKVRGFCHLSIGQEAIAVGIEHSITPDDKLITAYRCHGNVLMRGAGVKAIVAELLGRQGGCANAKGGSVHMYYKNFYGGNGIVGAQVPLGAGLAFAQQYNNTGNVTVALYGDGAANQGQVFEAFNLAKLWNLPVIFGCENNKFAMGTSAARGSALTDYYKRGHYIPGLRVNGMDVLAVLAAGQFGRDHLRSGKGPLVYEYVTYRFSGHSVSDPGTTYRTRADVQAMRESSDPVVKYASRLIEWEVAREEDLKAIEDKITSEVDREVAQAEQMPFPEAVPEKLFEDSYVRGSEPEWVRGRTPDENFYF